MNHYRVSAIVAVDDGPDWYQRVVLDPFTPAHGANLALTRALSRLPPVMAHPRLRFYEVVEHGFRSELFKLVDAKPYRPETGLLPPDPIHWIMVYPSASKSTLPADLLKWADCLAVVFGHSSHDSAMVAALNGSQRTERFEWFMVADSAGRFTVYDRQQAQALPAVPAPADSSLRVSADYAIHD